MPEMRDRGSETRSDHLYNVRIRNLSTWGGVSGIMRVYVYRLAPARPPPRVERLAWSAFTCFNCVTGLPGRGTNEITQMAASYTARAVCSQPDETYGVSTVEYRMSMCMAVLQCSSLTYRPACPHSPTDTASPQPARCIPFPNRREVDLGKGSEGTEVAPRGLHL